MWLALYLTSHNIHNRQTSMPPAEFEPKTAPSERPQTHALDRAAIGIGFKWKYSSTNSLTLALGGGL